MASSLLAKRATASTLFSKLINPLYSTSTLAVAPPLSRSFNTQTQVANFANDDLGTVDADRCTSNDSSLSRRRRDTPLSSFSLEAIDPFSPTRTLSQVFNLMDQLMDMPLSGRGNIGGGIGARRGWDVKEDDKALYLRLDMPGLSKEDVKVSVEDGTTLVIKGEIPNEDDIDNDDDDDGSINSSRRRYSSRLQLSPNLYKFDDIKAEMKNGVLKVAVPKVTQDDRKDVHHVQIE